MKYKISPYPFLKWAGGKRQLLSQLEHYFPRNFRNYIEPFVGGGAVFFHLYNRGYIKNRAILIDINEELINCYKVIKNNVNELIESLRKHRNEKDYYYKIRNLDRNRESYLQLSSVEKASRIIFLNKCCYNGLYRVNSKGEFNVPFGRYKNPNFCDEQNLRDVSNILQNVELLRDCFEICLKFADNGDFIYLDPPYHPLSDTSSFTSYTKGNFGLNSQKKLAQLYERLDQKGCILLLSNSKSDIISELYRNYTILELQANRAINSVASKRGSIKELLIVNKHKTIKDFL